MKAAACSAARAALWLLAFWTFVWSCFLLMEYVSGHMAVSVMHDSGELTSAQQVSVTQHASGCRTLLRSSADRAEPHVITQIVTALPDPHRILATISGSPASCMTAHKQVQQALQCQVSRSQR